MTASGGLLPASIPRRAVGRGLARTVTATVVVLAAYFVLPLDRLDGASAWLALPAALAGFVALVVWEVRAITRGQYPGIRALEALGTVVPLFLVIFAGTYFVMAQVEPAWFSEELSRLDSLYFTVTVFATVGFGDITATSGPSRVVATVQMAADLLVLGIGLRVIVGAVQLARRREHRDVPTEPG